MARRLVLFVATLPSAFDVVPHPHSDPFPLLLSTFHPVCPKPTVLALAILIQSTSAFYIIPQENPLNRHHVLSPLITHLSPLDVQYPIISRLVYSTTLNPPFNPAGAILALQYQMGHFNEDVVKHFRNSGIQALILQMISDLDSPGFGETVVQRQVSHDSPFPVFEITVGQTKSLAGWFQNQTANGVIVSIDGPETNPWQFYIDTAWPIGSLVVLVTAAIVLVAAIYKLTIMIHEQGPQLSVGQCVLSLVVFAMVIRVVWCIIDPFGIYKTTQFAWVQVGSTLPFAIIIGNTLLITLYWHELIRKTGTSIHVFLDKMLIPFLVFIFLFAGFELATSLARGLKLATKALIHSISIVYAIVIFVVVLYFVITNIRITLLFNKFQKTMHSNKKRSLAKATSLVAGIAITMIIWLVPVLMIAFASFLWDPAGFTAIWFVLLFGLNVVAFLQVLLIRAPKRPWKWILCGICMKYPQDLLPAHSTTGSTLHSGSASTNTSSKALQRSSVQPSVGSFDSHQNLSVDADELYDSSDSDDSVIPMARTIQQQAKSNGKEEDSV